MVAERRFALLYCLSSATQREEQCPSTLVTCTKGRACRHPRSSLRRDATQLISVSDPRPPPAANTLLHPRERRPHSGMLMNPRSYKAAAGSMSTPAQITAKTSRAIG